MFPIIPNSSKHVIIIILTLKIKCYTIQTTWESHYVFFKEYLVRDDLVNLMNYVKSKQNIPIWKNHI